MKLRDLLPIGTAIGAIALVYQLGCASVDKAVVGYKVDNQYGVTKEGSKCRLSCIEGKAYLNRKEISCEDLLFKIKWDNKGKQELSDAVKELEPFKCEGLDKRIAVEAYIE